MKHLLYILILLGFISGTSNAASFSVECPIYALHLENRNEIFDINSKLSISERFYGQSKINFKNGIITKIIEHDLGAGFTNAYLNGDLNGGIKTFLDKNSSILKKNISKPDRFYNTADNGAYYELKLTHSRNFNDSTFGTIELYFMQDEDLKGIIFICELDQNTLNEDEIYKFISSIEIDVTGLRISSLKDTLDNDLISKAEYKIRKKEILENHYPITNKLEELRLKRLKHKITCSEFKYEMRNILKVKFHRYENNCKNVTYLGPIISGYIPQ